MAEDNTNNSENNTPDDGDKGNLIETTGRRVQLNPVPLTFGGAKSGSTKKEIPPPRRKGLPTAAEARAEYEELENPRKIIRQGMLVIFLFFGVLGVWSFFGHIQGAVVAQGRIKIDNERKIVQHLEGGIIDKILVKEGQEVVKGEPLVVLQSVQMDANAKMTQKELVSLSAQRQRAIAEKDGNKTLDWTDSLKLMAQETQSLDVLANEEKIFATRQQTRETQISLLKAQIDQLKANVLGNEEQLAAENRIIAALQEELASKRKLHRERYLDKAQILGLERDLAGHQGTRGKTRQTIAELKQREAELNLRITEIERRFTEEATRNLGDAENKLIQTRERLRPLVDAAQRLQITAPVSGRVVDLKIHTPGSVVHAGETIMDIVPHDNALIVETQVPPNRITEVYVGQPALVQLDAFDTRMIPKMEAHVSYISADSVIPPGAPPEAAYYLCYVEVNPDSLDEEQLYLSPGMPATVFITTTERTIIYYMFEPYLKSWERALRD